MLAGQTEPFHSEIESRSSEPSDGTDRLTRLDVHAQSALLREAFEELDPSEGETSALASSPKRNGFLPRFGRRTLKSALGLAIVVVAGVGPVQRLFEYSSVEALVNAPLITIRAPIEGKIEDAGVASTIGGSAPKGLDLLRISNTRADRGRLDDLQRLVDQAEDERPAIAKRLARLKEIYQQVSQQVRSFQAGRVRELEERVMDLKAQTAAVQASGLEAESTLARTKALASSGYQTAVAVERAERDAKVTAQNESALNHRLFASLVELEAARGGEYVGDSYNDRPSSLQQADELSIRVAEAESDLASRDQRLTHLHAALSAEASRYAELSNAILSSPTNTLVWQVLVAPGEDVRKGQDLLRLLDCSAAMVTVVVRESVFNRLHLGDKAQFRFSGRSEKYSGTIIRLSGSPALSDNLAIQRTSLTSGEYQVAVSVPELAAKQCSVGRTGTVTFTPSENESPRSRWWSAISFFWRP